mgnify:FL=1
MDIDERLVRIAESSCRGLVSRIDAEFISRKEFCYAWSIAGDKAVLKISDYLIDAPEDVLGDLSRCMVLRGLGRPWEIPPSFIQYVDSDSFVTAKRPLYIRRSRNLTRSEVGGYRVLTDSLDRLLESGLISPTDIDNSYISWTRSDSIRRVGFCATMFRTIGISSALDDTDVSSDALDYVVYHECLHLRQRYRPTGRVHDAEFRGWEHSFPGWKGCESELRRLRLHRCYYLMRYSGEHGEARIHLPWN